MSSSLSPTSSLGFNDKGNGGSFEIGSLVIILKGPRYTAVTTRYITQDWVAAKGTRTSLLALVHNVLSKKMRYQYLKDIIGTEPASWRAKSKLDALVSPGLDGLGDNVRDGAATANSESTKILLAASARHLVETTDIPDRYYTNVDDLDWRYKGAFALIFSVLQDLQANKDGFWARSLGVKGLSSWTEPATPTTPGKRARRNYNAREGHIDTASAGQPIRYQKEARSLNGPSSATSTSRSTTDRRSEHTLTKAGVTSTTKPPTALQKSNVLGPADLTQEPQQDHAAVRVGKKRFRVVEEADATSRKMIKDGENVRKRPVVISREGNDAGHSSSSPTDPHVVFVSQSRSEPAADNYHPPPYKPTPVYEHVVNPTSAIQSTQDLPSRAEHGSFIAKEGINDATATLEQESRVQQPNDSFQQAAVYEAPKEAPMAPNMLMSSKSAVIELYNGIDRFVADYNSAQSRIEQLEYELAMAKSDATTLRSERDLANKENEQLRQQLTEKSRQWETVGADCGKDFWLSTDSGLCMQPLRVHHFDSIWLAFGIDFVTEALKL